MSMNQTKEKRIKIMLLSYKSLLLQS